MKWLTFVLLLPRELLTNACLFNVGCGWGSDVPGNSAVKGSSTRRWGWHRRRARVHSALPGGAGAHSGVIKPPSPRHRYPLAGASRRMRKRASHLNIRRECTVDGITTTIRNHLKTRHIAEYDKIVHTLRLKNSDEVPGLTLTTPSRSRAPKFDLNTWYQLLIEWIVTDDQATNVVDNPKFRIWVFMVATTLLTIIYYGRPVHAT
ncbi:hypothetical protein BGY98DRAFT_1095762 [Russula aff. rugulosa BPL654]|nr:hypothetical protein BGY98DRAFT_1095762 [Russula aff. rugulosa BPL654]